MARGYPDFGIVSDRERIVLPSDIPELAARLGSIMTFEKRGLVVSLDDFEATTLKWSVTAMGTVSAGALDTTTARSGKQSFKGTVGAAVGASVVIARGAPVLASERLGFEFSFAVMHTDLYLYLRLWHYDGTYRKKAGVYIYGDTGLCQYVDSSGNPQTIVTIGELQRSANMFQSFKVVVDFADNKYARFMINNSEIDISAHAIETEGNIEAPRTDIMLYVYSEAIGTRVIYIDDFIMTSTEP